MRVWESKYAYHTKVHCTNGGGRSLCNLGMHSKIPCLSLSLTSSIPDQFITQLFVPPFFLSFLFFTAAGIIMWKGAPTIIMPWKPTCCRAVWQRRQGHGEGGGRGVTANRWTNERIIFHNENFSQDGTFRVRCHCYAVLVLIGASVSCLGHLAAWQITES